MEINGNLTAVNCEGEGEDDYIRVTLNDVLKNCQVSELSAGQLYRVTATDNNQHRTSIDFRAGKLLEYNASYNYVSLDIS